MKQISIVDATNQDFRELSKIKKEFEIGLPNNYHHTLIAKNRDGVILGFAELSYPDSKSIEINRIAIRKKYQKLGVGKKLMGVVRSISIKNKQKLVAFTLRNPSAKNFWKLKQKFKSSPFGVREKFMEELTLKPKAVKRKIKPFKKKIKIKMNYPITTSRGVFTQTGIKCWRFILN